MADHKLHNERTLKLKGFNKHHRLQYMPLKSLNDDTGVYKEVHNGDEIHIKSEHEALVVRYEYKNMQHSDGFLVNELSGALRLIGYNFRMERVQGTLWSVNVFLIERNGHKKMDGHDTDIEPPKTDVP